MELAKLSSKYVLPIAFWWPTVIPNQHYRWHGFGTHLYTAGDLLMAHSCSEAVLPIASS
jgi:hypothetical protein